MANELIPANIKLPAHLADRLSKPSSLGSALSSGISDGVSIPRISIKGSRFRINDNGAETVLPDHTLEIIIVGANPNLSKTWYKKAWTPDSEPASPDCSSLDGIRPSADSAEPQNDLCASCPQNQWGSKVTPQGQRIKACADQKRLAVVAANDPSGPVYLLQVTPAALRGLNQYQKDLSVRGIPAEVVKTKVSFDTKASFPKLEFTFGGFLTPEQQEIVDGLFGSSQVHEVTGEATAPPVAKIEVERPLLVKPAPAVEDAVFEEPAAAAAAPPARGFGAPKTAVTPSGIPASTPQKKAEPPAAKSVSSSDSLSDEINDLLKGMMDDDAA